MEANEVLIWTDLSNENVVVRLGGLLEDPRKRMKTDISTTRNQFSMENIDVMRLLVLSMGPSRMAFIYPTTKMNPIILLLTLYKLNGVPCF